MKARRFSFKTTLGVLVLCWTGACVQEIHIGSAGVDHTSSGGSSNPNSTSSGNAADRIFEHVMGELEDPSSTVGESDDDWGDEGWNDDETRENPDIPDVDESCTAVGGSCVDEFSQCPSTTRATLNRDCPASTAWCCEPDFDASCEAQGGFCVEDFDACPNSREASLEYRCELEASWCCLP